jgi:hypothetical protein
MTGPASAADFSISGKKAGLPRPEGIHSDAPVLLAVLLCRGFISPLGE